MAALGFPRCAFSWVVMGTVSDGRWIAPWQLLAHPIPLQQPPEESPELISSPALLILAKDWICDELAVAAHGAGDMVHAV